MVLSTEWSQVEVIDLINDGSGLGFGIVGGRSTGVVIKSILPGGIADRDGRVQSGDHILQIGDVNLRGLGSEQVATVLRQAGSQVRMVVARPVESTSSDFQMLGSDAPIVPTKILIDPEELDRHLLQNGYTEDCNGTYIESYEDIQQLDLNPIIELEVVSSGEPTANNSPNFLLSPLDPLPETERFNVELTKNVYGLGITVAGYVCEREDLSGIFVKSISEGSAADKCKKIRVNDRIIEVDGESLPGFTNHQAVEKLRKTGTTVTLCLERYLRGPKYEHLQEALAQQETRSVSPPSPSVKTLSWFPVESEIEPEPESVTTVDSAVLYEVNPETIEIFIDANYEAELTDALENAIKKKWQNIVGPETNIVVAHLTKLKGLGISLEGTVDVEDGIELRPHHYIRSILPEGPVGQTGKLSSGDELLEVNGQRLIGIKHVEVVKILRELPGTVRLVCARNFVESRVINTSQDIEAFAQRSILGGSLKNLLPQPERLVKAVSDTSINTSSTATVTDENSLQKSKSRSRSMENTNLAMWLEDVEIIELRKGDRGLGFSILDYQDPLDSQATVIVVRSLVPNGPAETDGRLKPGDRLISVNGIVLKNATLDRAVQVLKATAPGLVKLGVSKPLPASRSSDSHGTNTLNS
ncbi:patj [Carabus blaptoides fortunei]